MIEGWEPVPVSGVENAAYYFSTYNAPDQVEVSRKRRLWCWEAVPTGSGRGLSLIIAVCMQPLPYGMQVIESIMVNCNPETVSTDYDTSNKLLF